MTHDRKPWSFTRWPSPPGYCLDEEFILKRQIAPCEAYVLYLINIVRQLGPVAEQSHRSVQTGKEEGREELEVQHRSTPAISSLICFIQKHLTFCGAAICSSFTLTADPHYCRERQPYYPGCMFVCVCVRERHREGRKDGGSKCKGQARGKCMTEEKVRGELQRNKEL